MKPIRLGQMKKANGKCKWCHDETAHNQLFFTRPDGTESVAMEIDAEKKVFRVSMIGFAEFDGEIAALDAKINYCPWCGKHLRMGGKR